MYVVGILIFNLYSTAVPTAESFDLNKKSLVSYCLTRLYLVSAGGFEPPTLCLKGT